MNYITKQRKIIYEYFKNNKDKSFTAKELLKNFKDNISKATLYRTIDLLVENNDINKFFDQNNKRYEYQFNDIDDCCSNHLHLKCINCGKLIHLHCKISGNLFEHIKKEHGFYVENESSIIYGTCPNCHLIK